MLARSETMNNYFTGNYISVMYYDGVKSEFAKKYTTTKRIRRNHPTYYELLEFRNRRCSLGVFKVLYSVFMDLNSPRFTDLRLWLSFQRHFAVLAKHWPGHGQVLANPDPVTRSHDNLRCFCMS